MRRILFSRKCFYAFYARTQRRASRIPRVCPRRLRLCHTRRRPGFSRLVPRPRLGIQFYRYRTIPRHRPDRGGSFCRHPARHHAHRQYPLCPHVRLPRTETGKRVPPLEARPPLLRRDRRKLCRGRAPARPPLLFLPCRAHALFLLRLAGRNRFGRGHEFAACKDAHRRNRHPVLRHDHERFQHFALRDVRRHHHSARAERPPRLAARGDVRHAQLPLLFPAILAETARRTEYRPLFDRLHGHRRPSLSPPARRVFTDCG